MGKLMIHGDTANKTIETLGVHTGQSKSKVLGVPLVADKIGHLGEDVILNYNPEDDYIYINGQKWKKAGFLFDGVVYNGSFSDGFSKGEANGVSKSYESLGNFTINESSLSLPAPSSYKSYGGYIDGKINFAEYTFLKVVCDGTTYSYDISDVKFEGYIALSHWLATTYGIGALLTSGNTGYFNDNTEHVQYVFDDSFTSAKTRYITKIWLE